MKTPNFWCFTALLECLSEHKLLCVHVCVRVCVCQRDDVRFNDGFHPLEKAASPHIRRQLHKLHD